MILKRVISGGQSGADLGGVKAALAAGLQVGGTMPLGFRTLDGLKPEYADRFNMSEHASDKYPPRTYQNARDSDGTIRIAYDLNSAGERCTLKGIQQYGKPHFDVHVKDPSKFELPEKMHPHAAAQWIIDNNITCLNVAGNSEKTCPGIEVFTVRYLTVLIEHLRTINQ